MLFQICNVDETSKAAAFKVAIYNLFLSLFMNGLLGLYIIFVFYVYEEEMADYVSRLVWAEMALNLLFFPFGFTLAIGIKKDKLSWVNTWITVKVLQSSFIILLNFILIFVVSYYKVNDAVIIVAYTVLLEVLYLENIMFISNYSRHRKSEEDDPEMAIKIPDSLELKF